MEIGIGLPNAILGVRGPELLDWSVEADRLGFSCLGTIGRIAYDSHEELVVLAAAAAVTRRIELMTSVLVAPPRQEVLLAKQAATLDAISGGRFRLGIGIGGRDDDYLALGMEPEDEGRLLEETIATCRSVWSGHTPDGADRPVGPTPHRPFIVLGGFSEPAFERAGRLADGFLAGPMPPDGVAWAYEVVRKAADAAGRPAPRLYAAAYAAVGDDVAEAAEHNVRSYYEFDSDVAEMLVENLLRTPEAIRAHRDALAAVGCEELVLWPETASLDQVVRLAEAAQI